jgi:hypothetical protein
VNLEGTISMTEDWAEFDLDPLQALTGYVILMRPPLSDNPTDVERVDAAYEFFNGDNGSHYILTGQLQGPGPVHFFLVTDAVEG